MDEYIKISDEAEFRNEILNGALFALRALAVGSDAGVVEPDYLANVGYQLYDKLTEYSAAEALGIDIVETNSGKDYPVIVTDNQGGAAEVDEGTDIAETPNPSFSRIVLNAHKKVALVEVTNEMITDSNIDSLVNTLSTLMARAIGRVADTSYLLGSGSGNAQGLVDNISTISGGLTLAKLHEVATSLDAEYYRGGRNEQLRWGMSTVTWQAINNYGTTAADRDTAFTNETPLTLFGYPVILSDVFRNTGKRVVFGNFNRAYIARRVTTTAWSSEVDLKRDVVVGRVTQRLDGRVRDAEAARSLTVT